MNSREIILKTLYDMEENGSYFSHALSNALSKCDAVDQGFVTEVIYGVTKNKLALDHIITQFSSIKLKKMTPWVKNILRIGIYQMYYMDKIPHSAACNESVKLSKKYAHAASGRFINGVLRNISRNIDKITFPEKENKSEYLSVKYSYPLWIADRLLSQYGFDKAESFMSESNKAHPVTLRVNALKADPDEVLKFLGSEGVTGDFCDDLIRVSGRININNLASYKNGYFSLQNISSYMAVKALSPMPNELVMDICAAPGGKSCAAAEMMNNQGEILSFDIHEHKISLIENSAKRLGINIIKACVHDGTVLIPKYIDKADRIILDVPCSGLGVIHKKPDIKWSRREEDIKSLAVIQKQLLETASKYLKKGGSLLYSTCTVLKAENEDITTGFLLSHPEFEKTYEKQILTGKDGESGFYICVMKRNK